MADITLNYVNSYRDPRNGKMRHQFRRKGCRKIMLKGRPGSAEFMDHYAELLAQSENAAAHVGASKIKPGSIDALIVKYLQHDIFTKGLAKATQAARRPILDNFRQCMTPGGHRYGENRLATIQRKNITDALAGKTPIMQKVWMKALRHLIAFAIEQGECKTDPTSRDQDGPPAQEQRSSHVGRCADRPISRALRQRHHGAARNGVDAQHRRATARCAPDRSPAPPQRLSVMATEQDQPVHRQGSDDPGAAGATGRARRDAAQRRAHIPAHRIRQAVRVGGGIRQQVCRLVQRGRAGAGGLRGRQGPQLSGARSPQGGVQATRTCRMYGVGDHGG